MFRVEHIQRFLPWKLIEPKSRTLTFAHAMTDKLGNVPISLLGQYPALPPPSGVRPNFVDPEDRGPGVVPAVAVFFVLSLIFYFSRCWTKFYIVRAVSWDDCKSSVWHDRVASADKDLHSGKLFGSRA